MRAMIVHGLITALGGARGVVYRAFCDLVVLVGAKYCGLRAGWV